MLRTQPGPARCCRPHRSLVAIATLGAVVSFFGGRSTACLISPARVRMTFPGSLARDQGGSAGELALDIAAAGSRSSPCYFSLAGHRIRSRFDPRVLLAWGGHTRSALRRASADAGGVAARARGRGHAEDRGHRRRQRSWPQARRAPARQPAARHSLRRLLRRPRPGTAAEHRAAREPGIALRARRLRARQSAGRHLHRAADGLAAAHPQAARGSARHHHVDLLRTGHLRRRPDPGARRLDRRAAGGRGVRVAVLWLQRRGEADLGFHSRRADTRADLAAHGADRRGREALLPRPDSLPAAPLRPGASASWSTSSAP